MRMGPEKIKAVMELPARTTVKEVQALLGFTSFYQSLLLCSLVQAGK